MGEAAVGTVVIPEYEVLDPFAQYRCFQSEIFFSIELEID